MLLSSEPPRILGGPALFEEGLHHIMADIRTALLECGFCHDAARLDVVVSALAAEGIDAPGDLVGVPE